MHRQTILAWTLLFYCSRSISTCYSFQATTRTIGTFHRKHLCSTVGRCQPRGVTFQTIVSPLGKARFQQTPRFIVKDDNNGDRGTKKRRLADIFRSKKAGDQASDSTVEGDDPTSINEKENSDQSSNGGEDIVSKEADGEAKMRPDDAEITNDSEKISRSEPSGSDDLETRSDEFDPIKFEQSGGELEVDSESDGSVSRALDGKGAESIGQPKTEGGITSSTSPSQRSKTIRRKKEKKESSFVSRALRTISFFLVVLVIAPLLTDELETRFTMPSSIGARFIHEEDEIGLPEELDKRSLPKMSGESQESMEESLKESLEAQSLRSRPMSLDDKPRSTLSFISDVVQRVGPSVVRVDTESYMLGQSDSPQPPGYMQQGQGSGLIFSDKGFILTNAHVVEGATKVTVTLTDGRVYSCRVMGSDEIVDIAVLKIIDGDSLGSIPNLPVADLGDSDKLSVGKIVIAVGSPGGLDNTVTMGIVSGLERSSTIVGIPHKKVDYIQTDAAINPGNSGGPLVEVESGSVIGINAAIRAHMEGTSFAIPINRVRDIMTDLAEGREIHHGYLGLGLASCTPDWARQNNADTKEGSATIPEVYGAIVHRVFPRTPAENGGLKENDIILSIGGEEVKSAEDARRLIDLAQVGNDMPMKVLRGHREIELVVKPVDLAARLREMRKERQRVMQKEQLRFQELGPFRSMIQ